MTHRRLFAAFAGLALSSCGAPDQETAAPDPVAALTARPLPETIAYPEGIVWDQTADVYYVVSAANGAIVRVNFADNTSIPIVAGGQLGSGDAAEFPMALGLKLDDIGRLWIAGGVRGDVHIVDTRTGQQVKHLTRPDGPPSLFNDLAFAGEAAFVTDSSRPIIWRISRNGAEIGDLEPWLDLEDEIPHAEGPNLNGVVATPDGSTLIAVQMNTGLLWKVDIARRAISQIDLGGVLLQSGDGLVLDGRRLYATVQDTQEIVAIDLAQDYATGSIAGRLRDERFVAPATAFLRGGSLFVVVTQMNRFADSSAVRPFNVYEVPVSAIIPSN